jgi:hypothetical protein
MAGVKGGQWPTKWTLEARRGEVPGRHNEFGPGPWPGPVRDVLRLPAWPFGGRHVLGPQRVGFDVGSPFFALPTIVGKAKIALGTLIGSDRRSNDHERQNAAGSPTRSAHSCGALKRWRDLRSGRRAQRQVLLAEAAGRVRAEVGGNDRRSTGFAGAVASRAEALQGPVDVIEHAG